MLPWSLLILGSVASLAANVAVADPTAWSRIIHAWPSFALIGAYELLMRELRSTAAGVGSAYADGEQLVGRDEGSSSAGGAALHLIAEQNDNPDGEEPLSPFQAQAWRRGLEQEAATGSLPTGRRIAEQFGRKERWGRLVKKRGFHAGSEARPQSENNYAVR